MSWQIGCFVIYSASRYFILEKLILCLEKSISLFRSPISQSSTDPVSNSGRMNILIYGFISELINQYCHCMQALETLVSLISELNYKSYNRLLPYYLWVLRSKIGSICCLYKFLIGHSHSDMTLKWKCGHCYKQGP